ncbi:MAG: hypothetical protein GY765_12795 [bacterium]|nr:hypothetical protein [bacterium]
MNKRSYKKLVLVKKTVADLNHKEISTAAKGGTGYTVCGYTECGFFCMTDTNPYPPTDPRVCRTMHPCGNDSNYPCP